MNKVEFANSEIEVVNTPQSVYDSFNNFIFRRYYEKKHDTNYG